MMTSKLNRTLLLTASLFILSCTSKTPEDACDCIKETANAFMLQGTQISNIDDLREPCKETIDLFTEDAAARALITDCGKEVLEALERKELFEVNGVKPEFPTKSFNTIEELNSFLTEGSDKYKFHNYNIVINNSYVHTDNARLESLCQIPEPIVYDEIYLSDWQYASSRDWSNETRVRLSVKASDSLAAVIPPSLEFEDTHVIDVWEKRAVPYQKDLYNLSQGLAEYTLGGYGVYISDVLSHDDYVNDLVGDCLPDFVNDAAEGRYVFIYNDNGYSYRKRVDSENYLMLNYGYNYAMCEGQTTGVLKLYKTSPHLVLTGCDLKKTVMPEMLSEGLVYNISEYLNYVGNEMDQIPYESKRFLPLDYGFDTRQGLQ